MRCARCASLCAHHLLLLLSLRGRQEALRLGGASHAFLVQAAASAGAAPALLPGASGLRTANSLLLFPSPSTYPNPLILCFPPHPNAGKYDQVRINFANPDMVGHTGDLEATRGCCALVDRCVKVWAEACCAAVPRMWAPSGARLWGAARCTMLHHAAPAKRAGGCSPRLEPPAPRSFYD